MKKVPRYKKSVKPRGSSKVVYKNYRDYFNDWIREGKPKTFIQYWQGLTGVTHKNNITEFNNMMKWIVTNHENLST